MEHRIVGTTMPVLELMLQPNEGVFAESGELAWISMSIQLRTGTTIGGQQGGFMAALGRVMAGSTIFMTEFTAVGGVGMAAFCARLPGEIHTLTVDEDCPEMQTVFIICGPVLYIDDQDNVVHVEDNVGLIELCKSTYEANGLGTAYVDQFIR